MDLRNPRQIKRLYNSYNILQACHGVDELINDIEHGFPFMVSLFVLEMINQDIRLSKDDNPRQQAKDYLFGDEHRELSLIPEVHHEAIKLAENVIAKSDMASLLEMVEPFVLPSVEPEMEEVKKQESIENVNNQKGISTVPKKVLAN